MIKKILEYCVNLCYYISKVGKVIWMEKETKPTIFNVADFYLKIVDRDSGSTITPLKLQKILYYSQGYYLAMNDKELFSEEFEAWAHGPANEAIYNKYRIYGFDSIPEPTDYDINFSKEISDFLNDIWETFGIYDGKFLEIQTHNEEPWIEARKDCKAGEKCKNIISKKSMQLFFKKVLNGEQ